MSDLREAFSVEIIYGQSELRSWFELQHDPVYGFRHVGMGSRTDYDRDGKITAHKVEPTGCVMWTY